MFSNLMVRDIDNLAAGETWCHQLVLVRVHLHDSAFNAERVPCCSVRVLGLAVTHRTVIHVYEQCG